MVSDPRPPSDPLAAEIAAHHASDGSSCDRCAEDWPCLVRRLADEVEALRDQAREWEQWSVAMVADMDRRMTRAIEAERRAEPPESKGGPTTLDNLVTACMDCNLGKSDKDLA